MPVERNPVMAYKVFLVEDEIVTREGIRDNVDWKANGFEFCGEAPDGEIALPILLALQLDVLITDIKMPFMDGLQLCRIIRERMPWVKVIILSGHDEFEYAQEAIRLGVTEYLLKPVTVQDLNNVLQKIVALLDQEKRDQENILQLHVKLEENRAVLEENLLLKLVIGAVSSADAFEQGQQIGLDLVARHYLALVIRIEPCKPSHNGDAGEMKRIHQFISKLVENNPDIFMLLKDAEEVVLIMKGGTPEYLEEEQNFLLEQIQHHVESSACKLTIGIGTPKKRIADVSQSFGEALVSIQNQVSQNQDDPGNSADKAELLKVDKSAVEDYLKCGSKKDFDDFFEAFIRPLVDSAFKSSIVKSYIFMDIVLTTARFVKELGGDIDQVVPGLSHIETILSKINTVDQIREQVKMILLSGLMFRDSSTNSQRAGMLQKAKEYIDQHYMDPDMSLNKVAAHVNHSPSHFSVLFSQGTSKTFKEYLTELRMKKARELLRTTSLRSSEISYRIGYGDPHYFSYIFRKNTGLTPTEFRSQTRIE
jgi:two-component system, response regulator YesN